MKTMHIVLQTVQQLNLHRCSFLQIYDSLALIKLCLSWGKFRQICIAFIIKDYRKNYFLKQRTVQNNLEYLQVYISHTIWSKIKKIISFHNTFSFKTSQIFFLIPFSTTKNLHKHISFSKALLNFVNSTHIKLLKFLVQCLNNL